MTQSCVRALARTALALAAVAFGAGASTLHAQSTGKVDGNVRDAAGIPLGGARVTIVGTAFTTTTNPQGYYFFNSVPAGTISIRATYIGYTSSEVTQLRVLSGQTIKQDIVMEQSAVALGDIRTVVATNPLVPRDQVATKQLIDGTFADKLPVDNISRVLQLQPGVSTTNGGGISVRGSRTDEQNTYVDGVPVQSGVRSGTSNAGFTSGLSLVAINGFEDASITTGAASAEFGNAQGGIISITTRTGGAKYAGNFSYETDMLAPARYRGGFNMFQGGFSGPLIGQRLTFALSARLEGSQGGNRGFNTWELPQWAAVGIDTTFTLPKTFGNVRSDSILVPVYKYAVISGECENFDFVQNAALQAMRDNYGEDCVSNQARNGGVNTQYQSNAKLNYSFGAGSRISASFLMSGSQARNRKADGRTAGSNNWTNVATLNWNQVLTRGAARSLSVDAYLSYQWNNSLQGVLTEDSEVGSRDPMFGILLKKLSFEETPETFPVDSTLIKNFLLNRTTRRIGLTDRVNTGQYNGQAAYGGAPDGIPMGAGGGGGFDGGLGYQQENRLIGKVNLDWQADRYNRIKFGGEYTGYDITTYAATASQLVKPYRYNLFVEDRLDLGDVIVVGGLRYDFFHSRVRRWDGFPRISTAPGFTGDRLDDFLVTDPSHDYISPAIQVAFPVTEKTNFRLSYRHQSQAPDLGLVLQNSLADIDVGGVNSRSNYGADLDFGKTILFEFGVRHAFSDDMVLDVAAYNKDNLANPSYQYSFPIDPVSGTPTRLLIAQNTDFGNTRGLDLRLDRRIGNYVNGSLIYSFQDAKSTGSDPTSYRNFYEPLGAARTPLNATTTTYSRPHTIAGSFQVQLPGDFQDGSILGTVLKNTGFFATFRLASGTPYTRCDPDDLGSFGTRSGGGCSLEPRSNSFLGARLPALKEFDLRATKNFQIGKFAMTGYLDGRNILNIKNINSVWATTGTISNGALFENQWIADSNTFATFGRNNGFYRTSDGAITLPTTDAACALAGNGTNTQGAQCFYYRKSEQRFGNGDGAYTLDEQRRASDNNRAAGKHISSYVGAGRRLRFGLEVNF